MTIRVRRKRESIAEARSPKASYGALHHYFKGSKFWNAISQHSIAFEKTSCTL